MTNIVKLAFISSTLIIAAPSKANETDYADLFDMSIEELMDVRIITASKFEESMHDAHASISIITKEQISQFGGSYLADILERLVNVSHTYGVLSSISTRGSQPWTSIAHHLALINGRPFGNLTGAHSIYSSMPLSAIERIEFIRGPGSVLYGTNAYHGVINIITKKAKSNGWRGEQKVSFGSFNSKILDGSYQYQLDNLQLSLNLLHADEDGWSADMYDPQLQQVYSRDVFREERTVHIDLSYKQFSFSHYYSRQERFANFWDGPEENFIPWVKVHPVGVTNFDYRFDIAESWQLASHLTLHRKTLEWSSNGLADELVRLKFPLESNLFEMNLFGNIGEDKQLLLGFSREDRKVVDSFTIPDTNEDYASFYVQFKQQLNEQLSYMLGGQYVTTVNLKDDPNNKSDVVPRFGLIYDFNPNFAVKLLYGEAYRHPQSGERFIDSPGVQKGSPTIDAERISTSELQFYYQSRSQLLNLTLYQSDEADLIRLVPSDDPLYALENKNEGERQSKGIELEYKYRPDGDWQLEFAWAWQQSENADGLKQTTLMPDSSWKLGVSYFLNHWQLGLFNVHYGDFQNTRLLNPDAEAINPAADSFDWLTLKAATQIARFDNAHTLELSLELKNILDKKIYFPNDTPVFYPSNTLPGRSGFAAMINLTYRM